jgi:hypothetical protein
VTEGVNLFFIEDYSDSEHLGNAAGIPGSMGIANSWNGVLISLAAHVSGSTLISQLLGETAAHEMGHQLGLFHTSESGGTAFDILTDTAECRNGDIYAEECEGYGAENVMFWTAWNTLSRSAGKKTGNFVQSSATRFEVFTTCKVNLSAFNNTSLKKQEDHEISVYHLYFILEPDRNHSCCSGQGSGYGTAGRTSLEAGR